MQNDSLSCPCSPAFVYFLFPIVKGVCESVWPRPVYVFVWLSVRLPVWMHSVHLYDINGDSPYCSQPWWTVKFPWQLCFTGWLGCLTEPTERPPGWQVMWVWAWVQPGPDLAPMRRCRSRSVVKSHSQSSASWKEWKDLLDHSTDSHEISQTLLPQRVTILCCHEPLLISDWPCDTQRYYFWKRFQFEHFKIFSSIGINIE